MGRVEGKIALVTGAASGLGKGMAKALAREGANVVLTDILADAGAETAAAIGEHALFMPHDVTLEADWQRVIDDTLAKFGKLDVLVNNAGVPTTELIEETTLERWRSVMAINLDGVFLGVKYGIGAMKGTGGGSIINISSVAGLVGTSSMATYSASKGGVRLLTKAAAIECAELGYKIRVNSVHPGMIETAKAKELYVVFGEGDAAKGRQFFADMHPVRDIGKIEDIANGILYLASDESAFMTGSELVIDGGMTAR